MPAALDVDKEQMRMLVLEVGVHEASRRTGVDVSTVKQWSARGKWLAHLREEPKLPTSMQPKAVTNVTRPADALQKVLEENDNQSKAGYAIVSGKLAKRFSEMDPDELIACTPAVKDGVTIADGVFGWKARHGAAEGNQLISIGFLQVCGTAPSAPDPRTIEGTSVEAEPLT